VERNNETGAQAKAEAEDIELASHESRSSRYVKGLLGSRIGSLVPQLLLNCFKGGNGAGEREERRTETCWRTLVTEY
jgi:hypothetical protein